MILASREAHEEEQRAAAGRLSVGLALLAANGFGSYFVLSDSAADDSIMWFLVLSRVIPVPALIAAAAWRHAPSPPPRPAVALVVGGTLDCGATALYALANTKGALSIVSVVGSLYPWRRWSWPAWCWERGSGRSSALASLRPLREWR